MQIITKDADLRVDDSLMRLYVAEPRPEGKYPGILLYTDIFQLTGSNRRCVERLAGHGFVVAAPEIYHRIEHPGTAIPYDDVGRMWASEDARKTPVAAFDADARATLDFLAKHPKFNGKLGTLGFCIGGHLSCRAALQPDVRASVICYPTGIHNGKLGADADAGTLARLGEIKGEMLVVFGSADPHIPSDARKIVLDAFSAAKVRHAIEMTTGEHAFMRDEGPRYDSAASDDIWAKAVAHFHRVLG